MNYKEFGVDNKETMVFLHGGGLSWWNYREVAEELQDTYHIIIPILDGHAGSDRGFQSIEKNAEEIIEFIDERFGGKVLLIGGLSLGGQILLEILSGRGDICRYAMIESAMVIPSKITNALMRPALSCCYGLIRRQWFSKLQFKSLHMKQELFKEYFMDTCGIAKADYIGFLKANTEYTLKPSIEKCAADVHIFFGDRETRGILRSAERIRDSIPNAKIHKIKGLYHGEFSINHAKRYAEMIEKKIVAFQTK